MTILSAWSEGAALGLAIAAPFGPINVEIVRRHLGRGFGAGLLLGLGACSVDTAYILLISVGLIATAPGPRVQVAMAIASAAVLLVLAGLILRSASRSAAMAANASTGRPQPGPAGSPWRHYAVGVLMTTTSPMNLVFWFGVVGCGLYGSETTLGPWPRVVGVLCGTVGWVLGLNVALHAGRVLRLLRPGVLVAINWVSAMALVALAGWGLCRAIR